MIPNLPSIILTIRKIFDTISISIEVIPAVTHLVVTAETESKSESIVV